MSLAGVKYCFCVIDVSRYLFASLSDVRLRRDFEFPEEDHVFVTMKSEHSSPGSWSKMGLDGRHQDPTVVHLYILTVHRYRDWEPYTTFRRSIRTRGTFDKRQLSIGHASGLIASTDGVRSE